MKPSNEKKLLCLAICLILSLSFGALAEESQEETAHPTAQELNDTLNDLTWSEEPSYQSFTTVTLDGQAVTQELFSGHKLTMINIWGTFCGPCISEMPDLATLASNYEEGEVQVVGDIIDIYNQDGSLSQRTADDAWAIIEETGANYPHLIPSPDLILAGLYNVTAVPETIFVDENGNVLTPDTRYIGALNIKEWKDIIDGLLAGMDE